VLLPLYGGIVLLFALAFAAVGFAAIAVAFQAGKTKRKF
jgi:hypothetical protein